jgi:multidrug efflux pump subunit AcrB
MGVAYVPIKTKNRPMKLPKLAIDNYIFTLVVCAVLIIAGVLSYINMPRTENPTVLIPGASIIAIYPGASPNDLEKLIAIPIEESLNELEDIRRINTYLWNGIASIHVEFEFGTNAKEKYDEVVSRVNDVKSKLPKDIFDLYTARWSSADVAIMQLALVSESASYSELDRVSESLKRKLERSFGVKKVELHAIPKQEIRVSVDMEKMVQMNITLDRVINSISSYNANIPGGSIKLSDRHFNIQTSGSYEDIEDIKNTVVNSYLGRIVHLKDIATVNFAYEDQQYIARYNNQKAVFISIEQTPDINIFKITGQLKEKIGEFRNNLQKDIQLEMVFDQSVNVNKRIGNFTSNLIQGIILVGFIILIAIGFKSSIIVIIAIPLSIIVGLAVVDYSGFGLQQITIGGLVVALGLLVDNSIVIIENISRYIRMGHSPKEAAILGSSEIGWPIVSATVTTLLAFIPIILMPDKAGEFIKSLPVTIIATLSVSLFLALTLTPFLASIILKPNSKKQLEGGKENKQASGFLNRFIEGPYRKTLLFCLRNKFLTLGAALAILGISVYVFYFHLGKSFFPKAETPQFMVRVNLPEGTNLDKTLETTLWVESILDTLPEISHFASNIGRGNPRIYYNLPQKQLSTNFAELYVELKEYNVEQFDMLVEKLRNRFKEYVGAEITVKEFEQGAPSDAPIVIYIIGEKIDELQRISEEIEGYLKDSDGAINVENLLNRIQTDIFVNINKDKASMLGVPIHEIDRTVRIAINGATVSKHLDKTGKEYDIVVRMPFDERITLADMDRIYVSSLSGKQIPLKQLASIEFKKAPSLITRYNMERNASIQADLMKGYNLDEVMNPVIEKLNAYPFPPGYSYYLAGEIESRDESFAGMKKAIIIAIIAILAVLILQFNSFLQPLIIFSAIPLALIGSIWALFLTNNTFSFTAAVGLISLVGIVVNNSIILVDYTNILRKQGVSLYEAVQKSGETRFTPIVLTALTTIGGLLPLTLRGGTLWAPLGWTIIGGLLVSTLLTLIIVPVLYAGLERALDRFSENK